MFWLFFTFKSLYMKSKKGNKEENPENRATKRKRNKEKKKIDSFVLSLFLFCCYIISNKEINNNTVHISCTY